MRNRRRLRRYEQQEPGYEIRNDSAQDYGALHYYITRDAQETQLREHGYRHAWGLGRHIQGSQIFDYWRDPDRAMFEHYTDGDVFDNTIAPGWAPLSASGLSQWGPKATAEFTGTNDPRVAVAAIKALRDKGNEVDLRALRGLIKAMGK